MRKRREEQDNARGISSHSFSLIVLRQPTRISEMASFCRRGDALSCGEANSATAFDDAYITAKTRYSDRCKKFSRIFVP
jgi:hypothetical protein